MRYFLGLDVAKDSFVAALLNEEGHVVSSSTFSNDLDGFAELVAWLPAPASTIAVCEPTGVYNQHLKGALAVALESLHEINSQTLKQFVFSQVRTKTDEADALGQCAREAIHDEYRIRIAIARQFRHLCGIGRSSIHAQFGVLSHAFDAGA